MTEDLNIVAFDLKNFEIPKSATLATQSSNNNTLTFRKEKFVQKCNIKCQSITLWISNHDELHPMSASSSFPKQYQRIFSKFQI